MIIRIPDQTTVVLSDREIELQDSLAFDGGFVRYDLSENKANGLRIQLKSSACGVRYLRMRWNISLESESNVKVLGDAWERGYGNLYWGAINPERNMPWYMAISNGSDRCRNYVGRRTECFGVEVLPNCFALWNCDSEG